MNYIFDHWFVLWMLIKFEKSSYINVALEEALLSLRVVLGVTLIFGQAF